MLRLQPSLPARFAEASEAELQEMIATARSALGDDLIILGHHYQRDEVFRWADATGDSFKLARYAADHPDVGLIVFCGVQFMAESADVLTGSSQTVILPDLNAGCSMADMAELEDVEECWEALDRVTDIEQVIPVTYINSSAAVKAFVGERGGAVCTSSNCRAVLEWALERGRQVLFLPDQHLGRNTARAMGFAPGDEAVWNPRAAGGGLSDSEMKEATFLLWRGHCSVHQRFTPEMVRSFREAHPDGRVVVHPECARDVVELADAVGSTEQILKVLRDSPSGSVWGVGTEIHLVQRIAREMAEDGKTVVSLDPIVCPCSTMFRIDAAHLAWCLESLAAGDVVNPIHVDESTAIWTRVALERMLEIT